MMLENLGVYLHPKVFIGDHDPLPWHDMPKSISRKLDNRKLLSLAALASTNSIFLQFPPISLDRMNMRIESVNITININDTIP